MSRLHTNLDPADPDDLRDEATHFLALAASTPYEELKACYLMLVDALRGLALHMDARGGDAPDRSST